MIKVAKLILVMPAANTERALCRLKTWLCTTTDEVCFNSCMILHVHKNRTDSIPLLGIGNEFIQCNSAKCILDNIHYNIHLLQSWNLMFPKKIWRGGGGCPPYLHPCIRINLSQMLPLPCLSCRTSCCLTSVPVGNTPLKLSVAMCSAHNAMSNL